MLNFFSDLIKYFALTLCAFYVFTKLSKKSLKMIDFLIVPYSALLALGAYLMPSKVDFLIPLCLLFFVVLFVYFRYKQTFSNTFFLSIIALGITFCCYVISSLISIPISFAIYVFCSDPLRSFLVSIIFALCEMLLCFIIFKIKRFKSGLTPSKSVTFELLVFGSMFSIFIMSFFYTDTDRSTTVDVLIALFCFLSFSLCIWWIRSITDEYKKQVYSRNAYILEQTIISLESKVSHLEQQNEELSKIIHRDNKVIPAMEIAVTDLCKSSASKNSTDLLANLASLSSERKGVLEKYRKLSEKFQKTNISALDSVIEFLNFKAGETTQFDFEFNDEALQAIINKINDQLILNTLLCDLGENALIAVRKIEGGKTKVQFLVENNVPKIRFYDNGDKFDKKVIAVIGKRKITTHKNEGGSGIGLVTTFEILAKFEASFIINEKLENSDYTKYVEISFDEQNNFAVIEN